MFCLSLSSALAAVAAPLDAAIEARIDGYLRAAEVHERFTGAVLVARGDEVLVSRGVGLANIELEVPNRPDTVFRIASLSKQFTAAAILLLQERGRLSVHDPICPHLADRLPECPAAWRAVTVHHLLSMTAGMPGTSAMEVGPLRGLPVPWDRWLEALRKKPLDFAPGSDFRYANSGYTLLGFIVERLSGLPFGEFLQQNFFGPLQMRQTALEDPLRIVPGRATGYRWMPGEAPSNVPYAEIFRLYAAGGVQSTPLDLLKWARALDEGRILSRASVEAMQRPVRAMYPGKDYGYGLWTMQKHGRLEVAHGGNLAGFIAWFARFPAEGLTVIVLSNNGRGSAGKVAQALSAIVLGAPYEMPRERRALAPAPADLADYVGEYRADFPPTRYTITLEGGRLMVLESGWPKDEMHAEADAVPGRFFLKGSDIQFRFSRGADGKVSGFVAHQGDSTLYETMQAVRLPGPIR
jgi:CubicO group peptidase (beta-lactamase class C family)